MKLSELIPHTSAWLGIPEPQVNTVARVLRPAGLISTAGNNPRGAEMTEDDKINLLLGVCGVEVANRAADHVRVWLSLIRFGEDTDDRFAFTKSKNVKEFFVDLITKDLNGGAIDSWVKEVDAEFDKAPKALPRSNVTLDFYVDEFKFTVIVSRHRLYKDKGLHRSNVDTIEVTFIQPPPGGKSEYVSNVRAKGYKAGSKLIRRLDADNLRGWGACLNE